MLIIKKTNDLKPQELVAIFQARTQVFVVEQNCPYQEVDNDDYNDVHVFLMKNNELQAYTRIIQKSDYITFGRVLVVKKFRKQGLGKQIVQATLDVIQQKYPNEPIQIKAQAYLKKFYEGLGFQSTSDVYLIDNIPHRNMKYIGSN